MQSDSKTHEVSTKGRGRCETVATMIPAWSHEAVSQPLVHSQSLLGSLGRSIFDGITHHGGLQLPLQNAFRASTPPKMEYPRSENSAPPNVTKTLRLQENCDLFFLSSLLSFFLFRFCSFLFLPLLLMMFSSDLTFLLFPFVMLFPLRFLLGIFFDFHFFSLLVFSAAFLFFSFLTFPFFCHSSFPCLVSLLFFVLDTLRIESLPTKFRLYLYQLRCVWFSLWSTIQVCGWCAMNLLPPTSVFCCA